MYNDGYSLSITEISNLMNIDKSVINTWINKELIIAKMRAVKNRRVWYISPDDLYIFLKNNQDLWNATKFDIMLIGRREEPWFIEKRKNDNTLLKSKWHTPWTRREENWFIELCVDGYTDKEISKIMNRTYNGICTKKKQLYKENRLSRKNEIKEQLAS